MQMQATSQRRKAKKQKQLVLAGKGSMNDYYDVYGPDAKADVEFKSRDVSERLTLQDFQGLVLWALADGVMPNWLVVKNKPLVSKVVLLFMPGLDAAVYLSQTKLLHNLKSACGSAQAVAALGPTTNPSSTINAILTCPQTKRKERPKNFENGHNERNVTSKTSAHDQVREPEDGDRKSIERTTSPSDCKSSKGLPSEQCTGVPFPAVYYTLSLNEMRQHGYPGVDNANILPEFVKTISASGLDHLKMVAVDCEMCYTSVGLELTRVSLVDSEGQVLLDKLVKPANPITNYNTIYSGITAEMMKGVTTTVQDIQASFLKLVSAETIVIGHSAECDLAALKIVHLRVIDTAVLYQQTSSGSCFKPALRTLAHRFLGRKIQDRSAGHDSIEDARATMDLAVLKIREGPRPGRSVEKKRENLLAFLSRHGRRCSLVDKLSVLQQYAVGSCHALVCTSDDEVVTKATKELKKKDVNFIWAQLGEINDYHETRAQLPEDGTIHVAQMAALRTCQLGDRKSTANIDLPMSAPLEAILRKMNERVKYLYDALPVNAMLIVLTGHGDTPAVRQLESEVRCKHLKNSDEVNLEDWQEACNIVFEEFASRAETALGFVCIKH